jgi:transposase
MPKRKPIVIGARFEGSSSLRAKTARFEQHGRRLQDFSKGRPRKFDDATERRLRDKFRREALRWLKHDGALPRANSKTTMKVMREFAEEENVSAKISWSVLRDRVVYPVLKELRQESH